MTLYKGARLHLLKQGTLDLEDGGHVEYQVIDYGYANTPDEIFVKMKILK